MRNLSLILTIAATGAFAVANPLAAEPFKMKSADQITVVHAEGAQIYECHADSTGTLSWKFREPIASLFERGKTIGRQYAGPSWEFADGTIITAKVVARAPAATSADIPELMLTVTGSKGSGPIAAARTILRLKTKGGASHGTCQTPGEFQSVSYSAEYAFFTSAGDN